MRTFGLIPAAGKSRRMGRAKLTLPVGGRPVLEHVVGAVRAAGVNDVLVVIAPGDQELAPLAERCGAQVLRLPDDTPDMRATCLHGLAWMADHLQPTAADGWLLLPADHPTVRSDLVQAVLGWAKPGAIVLPAHRGRRGHPTWLSWLHVPALRAAPSEQGLNSYIRDHPGDVIEVDWPNDEILRDLDTPEDYERLLKGAAP
jgi:molybdenum cofactor cytidylyltransferase